tara:strand:+ start:176 stop:403 length:228 start_codon:yes stop_codon:yes gene_type:complete
MTKIIAIAAGLFLGAPLGFLLGGLIGLGDCSGAECPDPYNMFSISGSLIGFFIIYYLIKEFLKTFLNSIKNFFKD